MIAERIRALAERVLHSKIVRDSSSILTSNWIGQAIALATSILLARTLGKDGYGLIVIAVALVNTIVQFLDIRTQEGAVKFMSAALAEGDDRRAITFFYVALSSDLALMAATLLAVAIVTPQLIRVYDNAATLRAMTGIFMLTVPFTTVETSFSALLVVFKRFRAYSIASLTGSLVLLGGVLVLRGAGPVTMMWAYVAAAAASFLVWAVLGVRLLVQHFDDFHAQGYRAALREFIPFAFHTSLTESLKTIFVNVDILVLGALRPPAEVAFYRIAMSATSLSALFVTPLRPVIYPELTEAWARRNLKRIRRLLGLWTLYGAAISLGSLAFFAVAAPFLLRVLYGAEYVPAAGLITILMVGYLFSNAFLWLRPMSLAAGKPQLLTYVTLLTSVLRAGLAIPLIWVYGAPGAAFAFVATMATYGLVTVFYALPKIGVWKVWRRAQEPAAE